MSIRTIENTQRPDRSRVAAGLMVLLLLSGCSPLLPQGTVADLYSLTPKTTFAKDLPKVDWQLVVEEPVAAGGLDTDRIALRPSPTELKYFAGARWSERAPRMVQTLLVESFESTGAITAVGRQVIGLRSDYNLKSELREFQAEYFDGTNRSPNVRVRINAKIIAQPRLGIIASRTFEAEVMADSNSVTAIVLAFDDALGQVLKKLVSWTLPTADGHASRTG
jgi:cholesterol transport system auxiliary component